MIGGNGKPKDSTSTAKPQDPIKEAAGNAIKDLFGLKRKKVADTTKTK